MVNKILIVEKDFLSSKKIETLLIHNNFTITGIATSCDECIYAIEKELPDLVLIDIDIDGDKDGIDTVNMINRKYNIPIIYLTGNTNLALTNRITTTYPSSFISKPYTDLELIVALNIALSKTDNISNISRDFFFVKKGNLHIKVKTADINYIEADGSYCVIYYNDKKHSVSSNLNCFNRSLNNPIFIRTHRSYIININKVEAFDRKSVIINNNNIPISKSYQKIVLSLFKKL